MSSMCGFVRGSVPLSGRICTSLYAFARCSALQCGTVCCSEFLCVFVCLCAWIKRLCRCFGLFCVLVDVCVFRVVDRLAGSVSVYVVVY